MYYTTLKQKILPLNNTTFDNNLFGGQLYEKPNNIETSNIANNNSITISSDSESDTESDTESEYETQDFVIDACGNTQKYRVIELSPHEERLAKRREYYAKNREHINKLVYLSRFTCACGSKNILTKDRLKHERSKKHRLYIFECKEKGENYS